MNKRKRKTTEASIDESSGNNYEDDEESELSDGDTSELNKSDNSTSYVGKKKYISENCGSEPLALPINANSINMEKTNNSSLKNSRQKIRDRHCTKGLWSSQVMHF